MYKEDYARIDAILEKPKFLQGSSRRILYWDDAEWLINKLREVDKALKDLEGLTVQWHTDNPEKGVLLDKLAGADQRIEKLKAVISDLSDVLCSLMPQGTADMVVRGFMYVEGLCGCGEFVAAKDAKYCAECAADKAEAEAEDRCPHGMFHSGAGACPQCGGGAE